MKNDNLGEQPISLLMTTELYKVTTENTLKDAKRIFERNHVRHLPVVRGDKLIGILSLTDLQRISFGDSFGEVEKEVDDSITEFLTIWQVMKHKPVTVRPDDSIQAVAELLTKAEFHALPVVDEDKLVGIVTTTDIIKYLLENN